jgi:quercetin dioxygenase-like cupin family protein
MHKFEELEHLPARELVPGFTAKLIHTDTVTIAHVRAVEGSMLPEHQHPQEQVTNILSGKLEMTVDGETRVCPAGTVITIGPNVPHAARALSDCEIIDVFHPVREDYK